jgi:hypothetical protein
MENVSPFAEVDPISLFKFTSIVAQCGARNSMCRSNVMPNAVITSRNVAIGSRDT